MYGRCHCHYYRLQTKFAKVRFSQVSVCPHGGMRGGGVVWQGVCMMGVCMAGGMCGRGACMVGRCMAKGACVCGGGTHGQGGVHGQRGVHGWGACMAEACVAGGHAWLGACMAGQTATAAGVTHPTGMHSSCHYRLWDGSPEITIITAGKRSFGQGNIFTGVCLSTWVGGLCMMLLPVWLPGPMFLRGGGLCH